MTEQIVLIHGAWLTSLSWENYITHFTEHGYEVAAPEWPRKSDGVDEQRADSVELAGLGIAEIVDHYDKIVRDYERPPILIGHSFGGLFVQLLLDRGLGRAGVALDPAPPKGVMRVSPHTLKSVAPAITNPANRHGVVTLTEAQFNYAFANTFDAEAAAAAFDRYAVPETGRIFFENGFENFALHSPARLDYARDGRAPLLFVAADEDHTIPVGTVTSNFRKYRHSPSRTDLIEFEGRSHLHMVQEGWQEIADAIVAWLSTMSNDDAIARSTAESR